MSGWHVQVWDGTQLGPFATREMAREQASSALRPWLGIEDRIGSWEGADGWLYVAVFSDGEPTDAVARVKHGGEL